MDSFRKRPELLINAGLLVFFLWLLSHWIWLFFPASQSVPPRMPLTQVTTGDALAVIGKAHLFGDAAEPAAPTGLTALNFKLLGVFAAREKEGMAAIINTGDPKNKAVRAGEEVAPGIVLDTVFADHVLLRRQGVTERLNLYGKGGNLLAPGAALTQGVEVLGDGSYRVARAQIQGMLQGAGQVELFGSVAKAPHGGISVALPPASPVLKLGLRSGDVIRRVNDQPINQSADLPKLVREFGRTNNIRIEGSREGKPLALSYVLY
ncbi:MAG: type II secretion system protein N [Sulfuricella sp.]